MKEQEILAKNHKVVCCCRAVHRFRPAVLVGMRLLKPLAWRLGSTGSVLEITYRQGTGTLRPVLDAVGDTGASMEDLAIDDGDDGTRRVTLQVRLPRGTGVDQLVAAIDDHPDVDRVTASRS